MPPLLYVLLIQFKIYEEDITFYIVIIDLKIADAVFSAVLRRQLIHQIAGYALTFFQREFALHRGFAAAFPLPDQRICRTVILLCE